MQHDVPEYVLSKIGNGEIVGRGKLFYPEWKKYWANKIDEHCASWSTRIVISFHQALAETLVEKWNLRFVYPENDWY